MKLIIFLGLILHTLCMLDTKASQSIFREASEDDLPALNALMRRSKEVAGHTRYTKEYLDEFMTLLSFTPKDLKVSKAHVLFVDTNLVGFYSLYINEMHELELDNFFLAPEFLYQGYGKILWDHCIRTAKEYQDKNFIIIWSVSLRQACVI